MRRKWFNYFWYGLVVVFVPLFWILGEYWGWWVGFESGTLDWRYRLRGLVDVPVDLIYVDIDGPAVAMMGERPVPRAFYGEAIEGLFRYGRARVVGMDVVFSDHEYSFLVDRERVDRDNEYFRGVIGKYYDSVVLAGRVDERGMNLEGPVEGLVGGQGVSGGDRMGDEGVNIGLINVVERFEEGGIVDWVPMYVVVGDVEKVYYTMALEVVRLFYGVGVEDVVFREKEVVMWGGDGSVLMSIPLRDGKWVEVNWFSKWMAPWNREYSFKEAVEVNRWMEWGDRGAREWFVEGRDRHYSLKDVIEAYHWMSGEDEGLRGRAERFFEDFEGAIVLIGETDPVFNNLAPTPFDEEPVPKIGIHGNLVKTLMSGNFLIRFSMAGQVGVMYLLTLLVVLPIILFPRRGVRLVSVGVVLVYLVMVVGVFSEWSWVLPVVVPVGSALSVTFLVLLVQLVGVERQRSRITGMFGAYVSPELVRVMVEEGVEPKLGGEERVVTALFSDIEHFSEIAEGMSPSGLIGLMNEYLFEMTKVIQEEGGTLDKYVGDGIIAMFGAPVGMEGHAVAACRAALRMQLKQRELCERWRVERSGGGVGKGGDVGGGWPEGVLGMRTRVGISTGLVVVGNMGSPIRFNYTMLGNAVNLAARCEGLAKEYGVCCVVTEGVWREVEGRGFRFRFLGKVVMNGIGKGIGVYELVG